MVEIFVSSPVLHESAQSPLHGRNTATQQASRDGAIGVALTERFGLSICEVAAWPDDVSTVKRYLPKQAKNFEFAPRRWLVVSEDEKSVAKLAKQVSGSGTVVDLSHGRTVIRIKGPSAVWVLAKLFAIDFEMMARGSGLATTHHAVSAQIWREDETTFDVIVFRSFALSFWETLIKSCRDVGYEVA